MGRTKTSKFHDLWIYGPLGTHIYGFKHTKNIWKIDQNNLYEYKEHMGTFLDNIILMNLRISGTSFLSIWEKTGTDKSRGVVE